MRTLEGYLHGVNLGGWLSQTSDTSAEHYTTFITEQDIATIAELGLDHVRVPVDYMLLEEEDGTEKPEGYVYLDSCLNWCKKHGLRMILDLHKTYGYSFDPLDKTDKTIFFHDASLQERFYRLWRTLSKRYGAESDTMAFELLNEIVEPEVAEAWNQIALHAIAEIRKQAPDTWIIFGGVMYNNVLSVPMLAETADRKVVYTFHSYEPMIFTHQGAYWVQDMPADFRIAYPKCLAEYREASKILSQELAGAIYADDLKEMGSDFFETLFAPALKISQERDIPLYCGEYGVIDLADNDSKIRWAADICSVFNKYGIGRAYWNYKGKDYGIVDIPDAAVQKQLAQKL
ncbi:glycoside hydrolase family 5 protein [uncultured Ruminococcus sp.]|uniref:glycoside hydrolase family 5 protein n=1 Tax=uncultured Ruminococcus sp. TaxID=165186 RepID=UPI0026706A32|nr:cellulase family glycosylhydrolase [uncultured Ruminococcus sp.]